MSQRKTWSRTGLTALVLMAAGCGTPSSAVQVPAPPAPTEPVGYTVQQHGGRDCAAEYRECLRRTYVFSGWRCRWAYYRCQRDTAGSVERNGGHDDGDDDDEGGSEDFGTVD